MTTAQKPARRPGRPSKCTPEIANELLAMIVAGVPISEAAERLGIGRRTVQMWRRRAWSTRAEDQPFVELEQSLWRARVAAAEVGQPARVDSASALVPLDEMLADLDLEFRDVP